MSQIHLWPETWIEKEDFITLSTVIEILDGTQTRLWYRLPSQYRFFITDSCDPFVIGMIFLFMSQGIDVKIHGEVSSSLLRNLEEFQAIWSSWRPRTYQRVEITAEKESEQSSLRTEEKVISAFSGGVDSCFTVFRHRQNLAGRQNRNLSTGLMVHGFDIPLHDSAFDKAFQKSEIMLQSLDMNCIPIATNFRQIMAVDWEDTFGSAVASCLHLLSKEYAVGMISSSHAYKTRNLVYGSNPLSDRLLSSQSFEIIHDGALFTRLEKIQEILDWPEALKNLRVCWQGQQKDRNCGRCEKCVRNLLNFRILGVERPACFEQDVTDQQIINLRIKGTSVEIWETLLVNAQTANIAESWIQATQISILKNKLLTFLLSYLPTGLIKLLKKCI